MIYPEKPAPADAKILPAIQERWSPLAFNPQPVEEEKIMAMFEAARWAPSNYNEQPWFYVYAMKGDPLREKMEQLLWEGNKWAKSAGILMVQFAKPVFDRNDKPNRLAFYDCGCATGYLFLQLKDLGLIGHEMVGFDEEAAPTLCNAPEGYEATAMMAVGYPGDPAALSDDLRERQEAPRERKQRSSFAFRNEFPHSSDLP